MAEFGQARLDVRLVQDGYTHGERTRIQVGRVRLVRRIFFRSDLFVKLCSDLGPRRCILRGI